MQKNRLINPGLAAAVAAAAVIASLLALASGGKAASPTICGTASSATANASCMTEQVVPHVLTAGKDAVSATHFTNEGGATATHVVLSLTLRDATTNAALSFTVKSIKLLVNETDVSSSCLPPSGSLLVVSCSVGNIIGGDDAEMIVRFSTTSPGNVVGAVTYGEGGNDSSPPQPNGTRNDTQVARDSLAIAVGSTAAGDCYNVATGGQTPAVRGSTTSQSITAVVGKASSANLPCTPASTGVDIDPGHLRSPSSFSQSVVFAEFATITGDVPGTVTIDFLSSLPKGFVLKELKLGFVPTLATSWAEVPTCASNPSGGDSCIVSKKNLPKGGLEYILNVLGSSFDPRYGG